MSPFWSAALGTAAIVAMGVGAWFLLKWAWRAITWPFRRLGRERQAVPTGLGSQYEQMVRENAAAQRPRKSAAAPVGSPVTASHYEQLVSPANGKPRELGSPATSSVIVPAARRTRPASVDGSIAEEIERLGHLHDRGLLSDDEFAAAKKTLLGL